MTSSDRFTFSQPHVVFESFADEVVLINLASGNYYSADKVGKAVIEMLAEHNSPAEIVSSLAEGFGWPRAEIEPGIRAFIEALLAEGLIVPVEGQAPGAELNATPTASVLVFSAPQLRRYSDMQDLLLLDPIHEVDESGWPAAKPDLPELDD